MRRQAHRRPARPVAGPLLVAVLSAALLTLAPPLRLRAAARPASPSVLRTAPDSCATPALGQLASKPAVQSKDDESVGETIGRIGAEVLGGTAAAVALALLGYLWVEKAAPDNSVVKIFYGILIIFPLLAAALFAIPAGIYAGGELAGGDSSYWATVGGFAVGALGGTLVTIAFEDLDAIGIAIALLLGLAGGVIGYELANESGQDESDVGATNAGLRAAPVAAADGLFVAAPPTGRGAVVGISLTF